MTKDEFKNLLDGATTIDEIIALRKQLKCNHFMGECIRKLIAKGKDQGYFIFDTSYSVAKNIIGIYRGLDRKHNFVCNGGRKLNELNGKQISDAIVYYSDGIHKVGILVKLHNETGL